MRKIEKILIVAMMTISTQILAIDTAREEESCGAIGFKPNTESFGNCVLDLLQRKERLTSKADIAESKTKLCEQSRAFYKGCYFSCIGSTAGGIGYAANYCGTQCNTEKNRIIINCN